MIVHKHQNTGLGVGMVCLICFVLSHDDRSFISPTKDIGICTKTTWEPKPITFYHNVTVKLRKGDGLQQFDFTNKIRSIISVFETLIHNDSTSAIEEGVDFGIMIKRPHINSRERIATHEVEKSRISYVKVNVTICCPGFHKHNKGKCEKCPEFTYGLNCSNECRCLSSEKCNQTTGECKRCNKNPAVTRCDEETIKGTPKTRTESSSIFTIVSHTTLFHRQKVTTKSPTNTQQIDVSVFPTAEESKQDPKTALQRGDVSTPIVAISVVISVLVMIIVLALLVKRYHGRYNIKKRGTTESVHKLMSKSSHKMNESHELTQVNTSDEILRGDSFGYKDLDGNRVYVSMYNAMNVNVCHEDSDIEGNAYICRTTCRYFKFLYCADPSAIILIIISAYCKQNC